MAATAAWAQQQPGTQPEPLNTPLGNGTQQRDETSPGARASPVSGEPNLNGVDQKRTLEQRELNQGPRPATATDQQLDMQRNAQTGSQNPQHNPSVLPPKGPPNDGSKQPADWTRQHNKTSAQAPETTDTHRMDHTQTAGVPPRTANRRLNSPNPSARSTWDARRRTQTRRPSPPFRAPGLGSQP